ncbi:MAG: AAA family ATPase [Nocardioides sp.]
MSADVSVTTRAPAGDRGSGTDAVVVRSPHEDPPGRGALLGRAAECRRLDELLDGARGGEGGVLALWGEPGIGKSALLAHVVSSTRDMRVLQVQGAGHEADLEFAAIHQLCLPLMDRLGELSEPQRAALETIFGVSAGAPPDHRIIGLAVLNLMTHAAQELPLLCTVDDAQYLDRGSAHVLSFVARRLQEAPIALVFTTRRPDPHLSGLPDLEVLRLDDSDARALLETVVPVGPAAHVRDRLLTEAHGNPGALLELPRRLDVTRVASGLRILADDAVHGTIEQGYLDQIRGLPTSTRLVLLVAAADLSGDPRVVRAAVERLGIVDATGLVDDAEALLTLDPRVTFRHPLARSAAYRVAAPGQRRDAHLALAAVTDAVLDADRHAWHRAAACSGPDESVARALEHSVDVAQVRGGSSAAAAFLQRAAALTADDARRAERGLAAARASLLAGDHIATRRHLDAAERHCEDDRQQLHIELVRAQLELASGRVGEAGALFLGTAQRLEHHDLELARETYLNAWLAAAAEGSRSRLIEVSNLAASLPEPDYPRLTDRLLSGYARLVAGDRDAAVRILHAAGAAIRMASDSDVLRLGWVVSGLGPTLWDDGLFRATCTMQVRASREEGALWDLPRHLGALALATAWTGHLADAGSLIVEAEQVAAATGGAPAPHASLFRAALEGDVQVASSLITSVIAQDPADGHSSAIAAAQWSAAVLHNGLGNYQQAVEAAQAASALPAPCVSVWALPELVEAAVRVGDRDLADRSLTRLLDTTRPCRTHWSTGIAARCRAVVEGGDGADPLFQEAIRRLALTSWRPELARAHLLYGEWLRREGRRVDAREQLAQAQELFASVGMAAFTERARRELLATGATARRRVGPTSDTALTPQEAQIASLVRDGHSNPEVAELLFLSPRTVEWHLRKVFMKLSITSRKQLRQALPGPESDHDHDPSASLVQS